jgi:hypothetical protein
VSDEHREVVDVGSGPVKPGRPARTVNRTDLLLGLLVVGVFVAAACSALTAWSVHQQTEDQHALNCIYLTFGGDGGTRDYDDLEASEKQIADTLDCDVKGR